MESIRAFIALELSIEAQAVLTEVIESLAPQVPEKTVKWVEPEKIHLTMFFLGKTAVEQLDEIYATLDGASAQHKPFTLYLDRLGCFPNERRPRVVWVGVRGDTEKAAALQQTIEKRLIPMGWEPDNRPFHAHLTVGRVKDKRAKIRLPWGKGVAPAPIPVTSVHLFESQLRRAGPIYMVRHSSRLGQTPEQ